jgi:hypothetical protein
MMGTRWKCGRRGEARRRICVGAVFSAETGIEFSARQLEETRRAAFVEAMSREARWVRHTMRKEECDHPGFFRFHRMRHVRRFCTLLICHILLGSTGLTGRSLFAKDRYVDTVDIGERFQTIDCFAASDAWSMQEIGGWTLPSRQKIAELLFSQDKGIGLSGWRFNLGGGLERSRIRNPWRTADCFEVAQGKYDWTKCENARWFLRAAKANGVKDFIAFCYTPPRRLTLNGLTCADVNTSVTNNLRPGMEHQFGGYLADVLLHFRNNSDPAERIDFQWISPINEPQWDWVRGQEGTRAANADILRQYSAIYADLQARNLSTHILGPESGNLPDMYQQDGGASKKYGASFGDYVDLLCNDSTAAMLDRTLCYHSYGSEGADHIMEYRKRLRDKMDQYPTWRVAESEFCILESGRDLTMSAAIRAMRVLHCDLSIANATSWSWWLAVSNGNYKDGLLYTNWKRPGDKEDVLLSKLFWSFGNFSRFVRPGMVRVGLKETGDRHNLNGVMATAYEDLDAHRIVAVYINSGNEPAFVTLSEPKHPRVRWTPYVTSDAEGEDLKQHPSIESSNDLVLDPRSIVTLVSSRLDATN